MDTIISLFPQNLVSHWADGEVVPIVLFVILVALSYNALATENAEQVARFQRLAKTGV